MSAGNPFDALLAQQAQPNAAPAQQQQQPAGNPFDQLLAQQPPAQPQQSWTSRIGGAVKDFAVGAVKGAGDTVTSLMSGDVAQAGDPSYVGGAPTGLDEAKALASKQLEATNTAQKFGKGAEAIAEFVLGDAALKSLSLGDRLLRVGKIADQYEKATPFAKAAIDHAMGALRQGAVAGTEETVKTGDVGEGVKTGAEVAGGSLALGALGAGLGKVSGLLKPAKALSTAITDTVGEVAGAEGLEISGATAKESVSSLTQAFKARAQAGYRAIDEAVDGELNPVRDKITDLMKAIKVQKSLDPEKAAELTDQLAVVEQRQAELVAKAAENGVADASDKLAAADKDWSRFKALEKVGSKIETLSGDVRFKGLPDPNRFATLVDNSASRKLLVRALGEDAVAKLQEAATGGLRNQKAKGIATGMAIKAGEYAVPVGAAYGILSGGKHHD